MKYYSITVEQLMKELKSSNNGLTEKEAEVRYLKYGANKLDEGKQVSNVVKFLNQFKDLMIIILIISAIISFIISMVNNESIIDSLIIIAIVILNAIMGFVQEKKADKAIDSLNKMQVSRIKVKRDGKTKVIDSEKLTIGDILILEAGDTVPADARIIWLASLKVDESTLTGESVAVEKSILTLNEDASLSNRTNMIYSGTNITYGKCEALVCEIGMNTEIGKIAQSLNITKQEITPLQNKINDISKFLSIVISVIIVLMLIIGFIKGMDALEIFMLSISLAVAAIPEGLPAIITITLSLGMSTMAKKKAIVRKMSSVETLGSTEIICSDKTGTITQNRMQIRELFYNNKLMDCEEEIDENVLIDTMILNNDVCRSDNNYIGDPTEIALYEYCSKYVDAEKIRKSHKRIAELPFDSDRKMMTTVNYYGEDNLKVLTKGSFDSVIKHCNRILIDNKALKLDSKAKKRIKKMEEQESEKAYRVLAYAYKDIPGNYEINEKLENDLVFIGITAMIDPPREDVKEAIEVCKQAHIKPIMITGDSLSTAKAIAKEIGILENDDEAILGSDLDNLNEDELCEVVNKYSVYARVSPMNKLAIVNAWKENNKVVAMTGDGVNDAPALKSANIGVGMGITGTEVSKGVSDIILSDDSFSTIVTAVKEGRRIFDNIRNVLIYLLAGNIAEVLVVFVGMLFGFEIFLPIQLLYLNLVTDSLPAISLAFESADSDIMDRSIRKKNSSFFTPFLVAKLLTSSLLKTFAIMLVYVIGSRLFSVEIATSMTFLTLILLEMIFAYTCRNLKKNVLINKLFDNKVLNKFMIILIVMQLLVFLTPIREVFKIESLSLIQMVYCFIIVMIVFIIDEISKDILVKLFKD